MRGAPRAPCASLPTPRRAQTRGRGRRAPRKCASGGGRLFRRHRAGCRRAGETPAHPGSAPAARGVSSGSIARVADVRARRPRTQEVRRRRGAASSGGIARGPTCGRGRPRSREARRRRRLFRQHRVGFDVRAGCPRSQAPPSAGGLSSGGIARVADVRARRPRTQEARRALLAGIRAGGDARALRRSGAVGQFKERHILRLRWP